MWCCWILQGMNELPDYNKITFPDKDPIPFEEVVPDASLEALELLKRFLVYQSKHRISARDVSIINMFVLYCVL